MSRSSLTAAHSSVYRKLTSLADAWGEGAKDWQDPEAALQLATAIEARANNLMIGVALLRHEARVALEARKRATA